MNCRPGDLAILIRSGAGNEGRIVRCIRAVEGAGEFGFGVRWITEPALAGCGTPGWAVGPLDENLRPIRDSDGEDEMLRIAGKPQEVNA